MENNEAVVVAMPNTNNVVNDAVKVDGNKFIAAVKNNKKTVAAVGGGVAVVAIALVAAKKFKFWPFSKKAEVIEEEVVEVEETKKTGKK